MYVGSILENSILAENFSDKQFNPKFWTNIHTKNNRFKLI
jgi:hypothetical protein